MGYRYSNVVADAWRPGQLVEVGEDHRVGVTMGLHETKLDIVLVLLGDEVIECSIDNGYHQWVGAPVARLLDDGMPISPYKM